MFASYSQLQEEDKRMHVYWERQEGKTNVEDVNIWGTWVKSPQEFFVPFMRVFL